MQLPKRFVDRAKANLRRYQKVLESARARDLNESDTATIVSDFLTDVLGYTKYEEVTSEFAVRSTFCDLAVTVSGDLRYLIEVKSAGTDLRENHLRQACDYAANQGVEWVILTNGVIWEAHRMRFEQPVQHDIVFRVDLLDPDAKAPSILEKLYLISKEAGGGREIDRFYKSKEATSRYVIAQLLLSEPLLGTLRRQLRATFPEVKVDETMLAGILRNEVIKRDALEGEKATAAERVTRRAARKRARAKAAVDKPVASPTPTPGADAPAAAPA